MVELPGIGKSPTSCAGDCYLSGAVEAIEAVRRILVFEIWDVLGYSTGSRIVEAYVKKYPQHIYHAVFLCPLMVERYKILLLQFCFWLDGFVSATIPWLLRGWQLKFLIRLLGFSLQYDSLIEEWRSEIAACSVQALKDTARMIIPMGTQPFFVPVPFSLIWGDMDVLSCRPRKLGKHDYFIHANHAAPVFAANEISEIITHFLEASGK